MADSPGTTPDRQTGAEQSELALARETAAKLQAALADREALLRELHHRVKNNLQIVLSLLSLQLQQLGRSDAADLLRDAHVRIQTMALAHDQLYRSPDLSRVPLDSYLASTIANVRQVYADRAARVRLSATAEPVSVDFDAAVRAGMLVNELVVNALKHAFPGEASGLIRVDLRQEGAGGFVITVADDGVGMPAGFDVETSDHLGLQLAGDFARQLGGTLEFVEGPGTTVRVPCRPRQLSRG